jgi:hypothetical protein
MIRRWRDLASERVNVDYKIAVWCRVLRDGYPRGVDGDRRFDSWIETNLQIPPSRRVDMLMLAIGAREVARDPATWTRIGGSSVVRRLASMPVAERKSVLSEAKQKCYSVRTILNRRELAKTTPRQRVTDIMRLARFVRAQGDVPAKIRKIADRYCGMVVRRR